MVLREENLLMASEGAGARGLGRREQTPHRTACWGGQVRVHAPQHQSRPGLAWKVRGL